MQRDVRHKILEVIEEHCKDGVYLSVSNHLMRRDFEGMFKAIEKNKQLMTIVNKIILDSFFRDSRNDDLDEIKTLLDTLIKDTKLIEDKNKIRDMLMILMAVLHFLVYMLCLYTLAYIKSISPDSGWF